MKIVDTKSVLLVGGFGTRLRPAVSSAPKALAPVGNRPFLELLVKQLAAQGLRKLIMCTGYLADQIEHEFGSGDKFGVTIEYSREPTPLGTGGALKWARNLLEGLPYFLVMNGDSFLEVGFEKLIELHRASNAMATIAVVPVENAGRYGTVQMDSTSRVTEFKEKTGIDTPGLINGGVYVFSSAIFAKIPDGATSLEKDVFPGVISEGLFALRQQGTFIDIGTPLDYEHAQQIFDRLHRLSTHGASHSCDAPKS